MEHYDTEEYRGCTIYIDYDMDCESPREWDNLAHMICFHPHYWIGDKHDCSEDRVLFSRLAHRYVSYDAIEQYLLQHKGDCWLEKTADSYVLHDGTDSYYDGGYDIDTPIECIIDQCWDNLTDQDLYNLVSESDELVIAPIAYYDHSGITVWIGRGHGWDSGNCGWIFQTKDDTIKEMCATEENWKSRAWDNMEAEMHTYDSYVRGECFRYLVEDEKGDFIDSCCGFIGSSEIERIKDEARAVINQHIKDAEEKRARLMSCLYDNFDRLPEGREFIDGGMVYRIDRRNLFGEKQLSSARVKNNVVGVFDAANPSELSTDMLEILCDNLQPLETAIA